MPIRNVEDIRNIVLCGHGLAGKTTLVDKMLIQTGAINRPASVDDGTSVCDFDEEEKHHKHSIESAIAHFEHAGKHFNVLDTPGYPDFIGQTIGAMRAVETAVPEGASTFRSWCISVISAQSKNRAAIEAMCIMSTAPSAKFGATKAPSLRALHSRSSSCTNSSDRPVVPITSLEPPSSAA